MPTRDNDFLTALALAAITDKSNKNNDAFPERPWMEFKPEFQQIPPDRESYAERIATMQAMVGQKVLSTHQMAQEINHPNFTVLVDELLEGTDDTTYRMVIRRMHYTPSPRRLLFYRWKMTRSTEEGPPRYSGKMGLTRSREGTLRFEYTTEPSWSSVPGNGQKILRDTFLTEIILGQTYDPTEIEGL